jgi:hypothetical protein
MLILSYDLWLLLCRISRLLNNEECHYYLKTIEQTLFHRVQYWTLYLKYDGRFYKTLLARLHKRVSRNYNISGRSYTVGTFFAEREEPVAL